MEKTNLICLVGASASGKTTIARKLEEDKGIPVIRSYTSREPRHEDEWGHKFVSCELSNDNTHLITEDRLFYRDDIIAYFNSYKSDNHYWATDEQVLKGQSNIYIVDPSGAEQAHKFYEGSNVRVTTVYLNVDEQVRAKRLMARLNDSTFTQHFSEEPTECPEVWARIRPDREIFKKITCDYVINGNKKLDKVIELLYDVIQEVENKEE